MENLDYSQIIKLYKDVISELKYCSDSNTYYEVRNRALAITELWDAKSNFYSSIENIPYDLPQTQNNLPYSIQSLLGASVYNVFPSFGASLLGTPFYVNNKPSVIKLVKIINNIISLLEIKVIKNNTISKNTEKFNIPTKGTKMENVKIFISHSSADKNFAKEFLKLLKLSIKGFNTTEIVYSSGAGHGFKLGNSIRQSIKNEIKDSMYVIALLSSRALESSYVLFECGMAWVYDILLPIIIDPDLNYSDLPDVLKDTLAEKATTNKALKKIIRTISENLNLSLEASEQIDEHIEEFLEKI